MTLLAPSASGPAPEAPPDTPLEPAPHPAPGAGRPALVGRVRQLVRYGMVSVVSTLVSLSVLGTLVATATMPAVWANVVATGVGTAPSFELNRRWVWGKRGRRSVAAEVGPFAVLSFAGLALSSAAVALAAHIAHADGLTGPWRTGLVEGANLAAFGSLWVAQFVILDRFLFAHRVADCTPASPSSPRSLGRVTNRFYVTTPIYYVNDVPHIGHAYTTVTADALARWHRLLGDDTFFLTGTDEHGLKVQRAAEEAGHTPQEHADLTSARFREAWELIEISYDDFIRTTEPRHAAAVQAFLTAIYDNGWIYKDIYSGLYCVSCEAYYTEADLIDGLCPIHHRPVEYLEEENWFFKLSEFTQPLLDWYEANPTAVQPDTRRNEALGIIRSGLENISISRTSITWGVPVPWDPEHVFYVWYDALINYATAVGYGADPERFAEWWPATHHLIGKDIVRFHCVYWPAMLLAAGEDPAPHLNAHGFLLVGGEKMSKTGLNQIYPADLVADFGVDGFRWHFLAHTRFGPDGDFSYESIVESYNTDLANNLGNLLSRVTTVVGSKCGGVGPAPSADPALPLAGQFVARYDAIASAWQRAAPSDALSEVVALIRDTNSYLEDNEPWKAEPGPEVRVVLGNALEALRILAILVSPALPRASVEIWHRIGLAGEPTDQRLPAAAAWGGYPGGLAVEKGAPLFPRIADAK